MTQAHWWERGILYQVYPLSFQDSHGHGQGDLPGLLARLDHLEWLGVDAVWLSPVFPSPMADSGYDVADYTDIAPRFGTLADLDRLIAELHRRDMRLILDFIPNHTSEQHPWFLESRSSRAASRRDWYIWQDPAADGGPPNNWLSVFGGSAWEWDADSGQYYLHSYLREQPDLNWRNPAVRQAMYQVLRFWLARGVDGFRLDAVWHLIKDERLRDDPPNPDYRDGQSPYFRQLPRYSADRPEVHQLLAEMRAVGEEYGSERLLIGEIYLPLERLVSYYGEARRGVHLPFNFRLIETPWRARALAATIERYEDLLPDGCWPNWVLGNHDKPRVATRVGRAQARVAAMLLLTLRGTPTLYYGDEIGMTDVTVPPERVQDPWGQRVPGLGLGRDPARTPMQWSAEAGAGFTSGYPWLPLADDYREVNVAAQRGDPTSLLNLYRRLTRLRRDLPVLRDGAYRTAAVTDQVLCYERDDGDDRLAIALNLGAAPATLALPGEAAVLLSTALDREGDTVGRSLALRGDEGVILRLD